MPIKPEKYGVISPAAAARMSASAATLASVSVMKSRPEWIAASYCIKFKDAVELTLNTTYKLPRPGLKPGATHSKVLALPRSDSPYSFNERYRFIGKANANHDNDAKCDNAVRNGSGGLFME